MLQRRPRRSAVAVLAFASALLAGAAAASTQASGAQLVAFAASVGGQRLTGFEIVVLTSQGTDPRVVAPPRGAPRMGDFVFTWSPDGRSIAYPCSKGIDDEHFGVCAVDVTTGSARRVTHSASIRIEPLAWGPHDQIVSSCNDRDVCFVDARSGRVRFITRSGRGARDGYVFGDDVVWSPDGRLVAFSCRKKTQQDRRFCFVTSGGRLTVQPSSWNSLRIEGWTPDSKRVVWWGRFSGGDVLGYHEQNVNGSGLEPLPGGAVVRGPSYSADGRHRLTSRGGVGLAEEAVRGGPARAIVPASAGVEAWSYAFQPPAR